MTQDGEPKRWRWVLGIVGLVAVALVLWQEWQGRGLRTPGRLGPARPSVEELRAAAQRAQQALGAGRLAEAEAIVAPLATAAMPRGSGAEVNPARLMYEQILALEGRRLEYRELLTDDVERLPDPLPALRALAREDAASFPCDRTRAALETLEKQAPDDDRVWLARANLALRQGQPEEAARWVARCQAKQPWDLPVWRAGLELALAADRPGDLRRLFGPDAAGLTISALESVHLFAWLARQRGDAESEAAALKRLHELRPDRSDAIERLAELAALRGDAAERDRWRAEKTRIDRARLVYLPMVEAPDAPEHAADLARLAELQGRFSEARGWWRVARSRNPESTEPQAELRRIRPPARWSITFGEPDPSLAFQTPAEVRPDTLAALIGEARSTRPAEPAANTPAFEERASAAGLAFRNVSGKTVVHELPETMGGGVALLDFDGDGWLDVYLVQGGVFPPEPTAAGGDRLYRNRRDGTFEDVSERSGLARMVRGYGHGATVGDVDNDGRPDLFLTRWRGYQLLRNRGDGTFEDVTAAWGLGGDRDWPTSAALADLDNDGDLDLYVCHYVAWDPANPRLCRNPETSAYTYCAPLLLPARADHLFRNDVGRFTDISDAAGITAADVDGRGLGVVATDLDDDGRVDLYVANDATANFLFHNLGGGKFEEIGHAAGVAGNAEGGYQGSMGVACGDVDGDGRPDLAVTNLYGECTTLYHNLGGAQFADRTSASGLATATRELLGFGAAFGDLDNDGRLDLALANGHVNDFQPTYPYAMRAQLLLGGPAGRFRDVGPSAGPGWNTPRVGRALALGDLDNDGREDVVIVSLDAPVTLLQNQTKGGRWLTLALEGKPPGSNRDAVGARVRVQSSAGTITTGRFGGGSYQSASDGRLHVGLGRATGTATVEVRWPSGRVGTYPNLTLDHGYRLVEDGPAPRPLPGFPAP
ncbi:MAG: FG-GAP-like repeat-containing protein [Isosphaeraceae bacterium]